jgi:hypothetical protein
MQVPTETRPVSGVFAFDSPETIRESLSNIRSPWLPNERDLIAVPASIKKAVRVHRILDCFTPFGGYQAFINAIARFI